MRILSSFFTVLISVSLLQCQTAPPEIDRVHVEAVIKTLAADDMQGRRTFTPGIDKASAFIQQEFEKAGLQKLNGLDSYAQSFTMKSLSSSSAEVTINGEVISDEAYFASTNSSSLNWSAEDEVAVVVVGEDGDMRSAFRGVDGEGGKTIIAVHSSHGDLFGRFKQFFGGASRAMELTENTGIVAVLTDNVVESYSVAIENNVEELPLENVAGVIPGSAAMRLFCSQPIMTTSVSGQPLREIQLLMVLMMMPPAQRR